MNILKKFILGMTITTGVVFSIGATQASAENLYIVKSGDTLSAIAQQFGGGEELIHAIAKENQLSDIHKIFVGQELTIVSEKIIEEKSTVSESTIKEEQSANVLTTSEAKEWIAEKESNGSYEARNGRYIGRYQLDATYLGGDYSIENQERVANNYVSQRYGSWEGAKAFWLANGWY